MEHKAHPHSRHSGSDSVLNSVLEVLGHALRGAQGCAKRKRSTEMSLLFSLWWRMVLGRS